MHGCLCVHVRQVTLFLDAYLGLLGRRGSNGFHSPVQYRNKKLEKSAKYSISTLTFRTLLELD